VKKRILVTFGVALILLTITSCKKYGHGELSGHVYETGTNAPIPNATITLVESNSGMHPFSGKSSNPNIWSKTIETEVTDSEGKYVFYFRRKFGHNYYLSCKHDNFNQAWGASVYQKNKTVDFSLEPFAYLKIRTIKNSSNWNYLEITVNVMDYLIYPYTTNSPFDSLFTRVYRVRGNFENRINWNVHKNPQIPYTTPFDIYEGSKIYINKGDTSVFTITYD